jgi:hypothetical protein
MKGDRERELQTAEQGGIDFHDGRLRVCLGFRAAAF